MNDRARRGGMVDRFGSRSLRSTYVGLLGEIAFARYIGVPWDCTLDATGGRPDVFGYEVRSVSPDAREVALKTKRNDRLTTRCALVLIVAGRDADDVIVREAAGVVVGYLTSQEIREIGVYRDPGRRGAPAWFVDDLSRLHPVPRIA